MHTDRSGFTTLELLSALALGALLAAVLGGICLAQLRLARRAAERAAVSESIRTAATVLGAEARRITAADVRGFSVDSVALRAVRGFGLVCGATTTGTLVRHAGDRRPDPAKDSVLVLRSGGWLPAAVLAVRPFPGCAALPHEEVLELRLDPPTGDGVALLLFESGNYYLTSRALRYRLGAEGRQPLTPELFRHPQSRFIRVDGRGLTYTLAAADSQRAEITVHFAPP